MKTMTCKQLGGPCDMPFRAETADEVIKAQDAHLKEMVAQGDESHQQAMNEMQGRWQNPEGGKAWYENTKATFAGLPEDQP